MFCHVLIQEGLLKCLFVKSTIKLFHVLGQKLNKSAD